MCYLSERHKSGIGFDQGAYNFTTKAVGGIIGKTRGKKSVPFWDIIKHQKDLFVSFLKETVDVSTHDNELNSIHHEFNAKNAKDCRIKLLVDYIKSINNQFVYGGFEKLVNITTQETVDD